MNQGQNWDREYKQSKFLTKENKPQNDTVRFVKWLKTQLFSCRRPPSASYPQSAEGGLLLGGLKVLDLGSGTGRNSFYFAELGAGVTGFEISPTALKISEENLHLQKTAFCKGGVSFKKQSIGEVFPIEDNSVHIVIDVTSSNSLSEKEREIYLAEIYRVLKRGGYLFVKALCKDDDRNAKNLLKNFPGKEKDTYIMPETEIVERVWSKKDFEDFYKKNFNILYIGKKTSYTKMNNRSYKRNFLIAYMQK